MDTRKSTIFSRSQFLPSSSMEKGKMCVSREAIKIIMTTWNHCTVAKTNFMELKILICMGHINNKTITCNDIIFK